MDNNAKRVIERYKPSIPKSGIELLTYLNRRLNEIRTVPNREGLLSRTGASFFFAC